MLQSCLIFETGYNETKSSNIYKLIFSPKIFPPQMESVVKLTGIILENYTNAM